MKESQPQRINARKVMHIIMSIRKVVGNGDGKMHVGDHLSQRSLFHRRFLAARLPLLICSLIATPTSPVPFPSLVRNYPPKGLDKSSTMATDIACTFRPCEPQLAETLAMFPSEHLRCCSREMPSISLRGSLALAYTVVPRASARMHSCLPLCGLPWMGAELHSVVVPPS